MRLVPKIIKPELMPAEWRALSRLEGKHIYRSSVPSISEAKGKSSNVKANIDLL